jgi:hypothetical protein
MSDSRLYETLADANRAFWIRFKSTKAYKSVDQLLGYKRCYENLIGHGLPITKGAKGKHTKT